jgi:hypothetical protein
MSGGGEGVGGENLGGRSAASGNYLAHRNYLKSRIEYSGEKISMTDLKIRQKDCNETGHYDTNYVESSITCDTLTSL